MTSAWATEWIGLLIRWFHLMIGIAWIGASFYFVWLNNAVRPPAPEDGKPPGVAGNLWAVHGGAFYEVTKYAGAPARLPTTLHWFKWEAYLTWISGFLLLMLHFWWNAANTMVDPNVRALSPLAAVGVGAGALLGGWLLYDALCKSPLKDRSGVLAGVLVTILVGAAWGLSQLLSARAAYVHVGAMIGTWMAANVFFVIIPGQRAMVDAMIAGTPVPLERGKAGALRSLHNNYLTLPVLFVMLSGHFPQTWGHPYGWVILVAIGAIGALYKHHGNLEERGIHRPWLRWAALAGFAALAVAVRPPTPAPAASGEAAVKMVEIQQIVATRCLTCHATEPTFPGIASPPKGLLLESPAQIVAAAEKIEQQVVIAKAMPLGNVTKLTEEERAVFARWVAQHR